MANRLLRCFARASLRGRWLTNGHPHTLTEMDTTRNCTESLLLCANLFAKTIESAQQLYKQGQGLDAGSGRGDLAAQNHATVQSIFADEKLNFTVTSLNLDTAISSLRARWDACMAYIPTAIACAHSAGYSAHMHDALVILSRENKAVPRDSGLRAATATVLDGIIQPWSIFLSDYALSKHGEQGKAAMDVALHDIAQCVQEYSKATGKKLKKFFTGERKRAYRKAEKRTFTNVQDQGSGREKSKGGDLQSNETRVDADSTRQQDQQQLHWPITRPTVRVSEHDPHAASTEPIHTLAGVSESADAVQNGVDESGGMREKKRKRNMYLYASLGLLLVMVIVSAALIATAVRRRKQQGGTQSYVPSRSHVIPYVDAHSHEVVLTPVQYNTALRHHVPVTVRMSDTLDVAPMPMPTSAQVRGTGSAGGQYRGTLRPWARRSVG